MIDRPILKPEDEINGRDTPLRAASVFQLIEELARRQNTSELEEPPQQWCDECKHFKTGTAWQVEHQRGYNPCTKRHQMNFYMPQPHGDPDTFGFFRPVCPDREEQQC